MQPTEDRSLIVRRPAAEQLPVLLDQLEWLCVPAIILGRRLDVQMAVHAERLLGRVCAELTEQDRRQGELLARRQLLT